MKRIYTFGNGQAEGRADMKNLLGGKGANLAEMNLIGVPVPPGFTITTEVCTEYNTLGREAVVKILEEDVKKSVAHIEKLTGNTFGDAVNPLLVSVRSGARVSMPGMMDTVLNLGINDTVVEALSPQLLPSRFWEVLACRLLHSGFKLHNKALEVVNGKLGVVLHALLFLNFVKDFLKSGVRQSTYRPWFTEIWATRRLQAWHSPATPAATACCPGL